MSLVITMNEDDFERLSTTSMQWAGQQWEAHAAAGWFEHATAEGEPQSNRDWPGWQYKMAYWTGDSWVTVMLMRSYLAGIGQDCEILWDPATDDAVGEYIILTNYETKRWKNRAQTP